MQRREFNPAGGASRPGPSGDSRGGEGRSEGRDFRGGEGRGEGRDFRGGEGRGEGRDFRGGGGFSRDGRPGGRGRDFRSRRKVCSFCVEHIREIDYKDVGRLRRYLSDRAKIEPRRKTGTCAKHQRRLGVALKNARHMALLPYTAAHIRGL
jgi:small subunit ribosomal protein S18